MEDSLKITNLCKEYPKFKLDNVSFNVPKGSITGFIGRNGAGKTTTLKAIMNLIHYEKGEVLVLGQNMKGENEFNLKQDIAFSLGEINYYMNKTIKVMTKVTSKFYKNFSYDKFNKLCELFSLDKNKKLEELSNGMKVKYSLALALSHDAKLLILDEPTSGLDPISRDEILEVFLRLVKNGERSILFSTHITSDLDKCADHIVYINSGVIKFTGTKDDFINSYYVVKGPLNKLDDNLKNIMLSHKEHATEFEGLINKDDKNRLEKYGINLTIPTLEDVMVYLERGKNYEEFSI